MCGEIWRKGGCVGAVLWALLAFSACAEAAPICVTQNGAGLKDGSGWDNALGETEFRNRLKTASNGDVFWVAKGAYRPATGLFAQSESFELQEGIELYGGFAGGKRVCRSATSRPTSPS